MIVYHITLYCINQLSLQTEAVPKWIVLAISSVYLQDIFMMFPFYLPYIPIYLTMILGFFQHVPLFSPPQNTDHSPSSPHVPG